LAIAERRTGAEELFVSVVFTAAEGLAVGLDLGAACGVGCATRSDGRFNGPSILSPLLVSHCQDFEGLGLTVKSCSQLVVLSSFGFGLRLVHVSPNLFVVSDTRLTPGAVVLLGVSGHFSSEKWKEAAHERQVARQWTEHWNGMKVEMGSQRV
jgi:hypothetical protein